MPSYKDKFSDRLMIPVFDKTGQAIGFTGRTLPGDSKDRPKYLNSPESPWFKKGEQWFGWLLARESIKTAKKVVIVEGNMDVIAAHKFGIENVLASQGTSFTLAQVKQLKQLTNMIWLAFDNDLAGQVSASKFFKTATKAKLDVWQVIIPIEFKDLDEYLHAKFDSISIAELQAKPFLEFILLQRQAELISPNLETQKTAIEAICDLFTTLDDLSLEQNLRQLHTLTSISISTLSKIIEQKKAQEKAFTAPETDETLTQELSRQAPGKQPIQEVILAWQQLCALQSKNQLSPNISDKLEPVFVILQNFEPTLAEYLTLTEYLDQNRSLFELMQESENWNQSEIFQQLSFKKIVAFFDRNLGQLMLSQNLKELYQIVKS